MLYFLTSVGFLGFFGNFFYEREKHFIVSEEVFQLRSFKRELQIKFHQKKYLSNDDFKDIQANVVNLKNKEVIKKDFDIQKNIPSQYFNGKNVFLQFKMRRNHYLITLKSDDLAYKLNSLKIKILSASAGVLVIILLIAYFIVRLSLRPLYEKIDFLNGFIRDTTHEINTPLSVILMSIEMFDKNPKKYLKNIKTASMTISNLYEDLVALKMHNKEALNEKNIVNLSDMLNDRIEYFSISLEQKNISLTKNIENVSLSTYEFKIRKIIDNLISNAVKYCNENGFIEIKLNKNCLIISNSGEGISKEDLPHIFELYTRFDKTNGGFGVGLNLVKKFTDELGFKITCKSDKNKTEFVIHL